MAKPALPLQCFNVHEMSKGFASGKVSSNIASFASMLKSSNCESRIYWSLFASALDSDATDPSTSNAAMPRLSELSSVELPRSCPLCALLLCASLPCSGSVRLPPLPLASKPVASSASIPSVRLSRVSRALCISAGLERS